MKKNMKSKPEAMYTLQLEKKNQIEFLTVKEI